MKVSIKNRTDGTVFQLEIDASATMGELRSRISSHLEKSCDPRSLKLSLGDQLLDHADSVTLKKAGLVSGDRLFMEIDSCTSDAAKAEPQDLKAGTSNDDDDAAMKSDEETDATTVFRDDVVRAAREYMENSGYSNSSLQSWSTSNVTGAELRFELRTRNRTSDIFIVITTLPQPKFVRYCKCRKDHLSRKLLSSFTVQPASIKDNVTNGVAIALSGSGELRCADLIVQFIYKASRRVN
ncbi:hypothetical protein COOONC_04282 [Cooperia oncophora]